MSDELDLLLPAEVAAVFRVSEKAVVHMLDAGKLPYTMPGRRRLVRRSDLVAYLDAQSSSRPPVEPAQPFATRERAQSAIEIAASNRRIRRSQYRKSVSREERTYFIAEEGQSLDVVKIGRSVQELTDRATALQTGNPRRLVVLASVAASFASEGDLHKRFAAHRIRPDGEWFYVTPELRQLISVAKGLETRRRRQVEKARESK